MYDVREVYETDDKLYLNQWKYHRPGGSRDLYLHSHARFSSCYLAPEHLTVENPTGHSFASIARAAGKTMGNAPFRAQGCIPTDSEILPTEGYQQQSIPKSDTSVVAGRMTLEIRMLNQAVMRTHGCAVQVPAARIRRTCRQARVAKRKEKEEGTYVLEACPVGFGRRN